MVQGVAPGTLSEYTKDEGPDPMYWAKNGFAVANPDPRGTGWSEGDMLLFGDSEAKDGYVLLNGLQGKNGATKKLDVRELISCNVAMVYCC